MTLFKLIMRPNSEKNKIKTAIEGINIILEINEGNNYTNKININDDKFNGKLLMLQDKLISTIEKPHGYLNSDYLKRWNNKGELK